MISIIPDKAVYTVNSEVLMRARGIIKGDETMADALERTTFALFDMDREMNGGIEDNEFQETAISLINDATIIYGTPVLTNAGREAQITAACTVLPMTLNNGKVNLARFRVDSMGALSKAVGTGYDLSELDDPSIALLELNAVLDEINQDLISKNKRPVASMATLRADHPKIIELVRHPFCKFH